MSSLERSSALFLFLNFFPVGLFHFCISEWGASPSPSGTLLSCLPLLYSQKPNDVLTSSPHLSIYFQWPRGRNHAISDDRVFLYCSSFSFPLSLSFLGLACARVFCWKAECPVQGYPSPDLCRAVRRGDVSFLAPLLWRLGYHLSPGMGHGGSPSCLARWHCPGLGMAPNWPGSGSVALRGLSADSWNHRPSKTLPTSDGIHPLHSSPCGAGTWHFQGGGTCGWSNSCKEYHQQLYVFTSLSFPHSDIIVQMKYMKWTLKSRMCAKMYRQECLVIEKNGSNLSVHIRENIKVNYDISM